MVTMAQPLVALTWRISMVLVQRRPRTALEGSGVAALKFHRRRHLLPTRITLVLAAALPAPVVGVLLLLYRLWIRPSGLLCRMQKCLCALTRPQHKMEAQCGPGSTPLAEDFGAFRWPPTNHWLSCWDITSRISLNEVPETMSQVSEVLGDNHCFFHALACGLMESHSLFPAMQRSVI